MTGDGVFLVVLVTAYLVFAVCGARRLVRSEIARRSRTVGVPTSGAPPGTRARRGPQVATEDVRRRRDRQPNDGPPR